MIFNEDKVKIAIIGDYASQYYLIGKELERRGFDVQYFLQENIYASLPNNFHPLGSVQGPLLKNYLFTGFWMLFGKLFQNFDIQVINGTYKKIVRADHTCHHYHGSDLRLKTVEPKTPSFVSQKELLDYSPESVFLPRCADPEMFKPMKEQKKKKNEYKEENGIDYVIGHFAHSPIIKGSNKVRKAVDLINQEQGIRIELINKPIPKEQMPNKINFCDLVIDHVNASIGQTYNVLTIESLLCEVPTACYYSDAMFDFPEMKTYVKYLDPTTIDTLKKSIVDVLKQEIKVNRTEVLNFHGIKSVTDDLIKYWKQWNFI